MPQLECDACVRTRSGRVRVCMCVSCVCDLPRLQVSWLVRNDRLTLSCTPHPPGPPQSPTQPTHLLWKQARSLNLSCVRAVWVFVCVCASQFSFVIAGLVGPVGNTSKFWSFFASIFFFFFATMNAKAKLVMLI